MVELVDTQRSGRCGSNPVRVRIPLRAQKPRIDKNIFWWFNIRKLFNILILKEESIMNVTILSIENRYDLERLNKYLIARTGIDFLEKLADLGNNEKKTEIDAKKFIKDNYPLHTSLSKKETEQNIELLLSFYATVEEVHDSAERKVVFVDCEPKKTPYEDNFRAKSLNGFLQNTSAQEKSMAVGFFPLS